MRALVSSGGAFHGAYELGVYQYLIGDQGIDYDAFFGTSIGGVNSAWLAQFPHGRTREAVESLAALWRPAHTEMIHKRWFPFGKLHALWKKSLRNSKPLQDLLTERVNGKKIRESGKICGVVAVCLDTGETRVFREDFVPFVKAVMATAAFPGYFLPIKIEKKWWVDGGVREVTPLKAAIDAGATEVDVVMTMPDYADPHFDKSPTTLDIAGRSLALALDEIVADDLKTALCYNTMVKAGLPEAEEKREVKIRVFRPSSALSGNSLEATPDDVEAMRLRGYKDAVTLEAEDTDPGT
jgi:NTE family protein